MLSILKILPKDGFQVNRPFLKYNALDKYCKRQSIEKIMLHSNSLRLRLQEMFLKLLMVHIGPAFQQVEYLRYCPNKINLKFLYKS